MSVLYKKQPRMFGHHFPQDLNERREDPEIVIYKGSAEAVEFGSIASLLKLSDL